MVQLYSEITEGRSLIQHQGQRHCLRGLVPWTVVPAVLTALINLAHRSQKNKNAKTHICIKIDTEDFLPYRR